MRPLWRRRPGWPEVILHAADFSLTSCWAFAAAVGLCTAGGGRLVILHVVEAGAADGRAEPLGEFECACYDRHIREFYARGLAPARNCLVTTVAGDPWRAILEQAEALGAGVVCVGHHDDERRPATLGKNAMRLMVHARLPVLVAGEAGPGSLLTPVAGLESARAWGLDPRPWEGSLG